VNKSRRALTSSAIAGDCHQCENCRSELDGENQEDDAKVDSERETIFGDGAAASGIYS